jgi:thiol-disulfide isomerase/thioredoxin
VCVALIGALVAGLAASVVLTDDDTTGADASGLEAVVPPDSEAMLAVELTTVAGQPTTLAANLDGRPLVVNLWAHSCAPCIEEMPLLEAAARDHQDIGFLGVHVNDPSPGDQLAKASALAVQTGITYPWVVDTDQDFFFEAKAAGMPTTLFLDARGRILATKTGVFTDDADLRAWIDEHAPPS